MNIVYGILLHQRNRQTCHGWMTVTRADEQCDFDLEIRRGIKSVIKMARAYDEAGRN